MSSTALGTYNELEGRDRLLVRQATLLGFKAFVEEMRKLSRDCGHSYACLDEAGLYSEAEQVRIWAFCWAVRVKEATGRLEFPRLVKSSKKAAWGGELTYAVGHGASFLPKHAERLKKRLAQPELALFYDLRNRRLFEFLAANSSLSVYVSTAPIKGDWFLVWRFLAGRKADLSEVGYPGLQLEFNSYSEALEVRNEGSMWLDRTLTGVGYSGLASRSDLLFKAKPFLHRIMSVDIRTQKLDVTETIELREWSGYSGSYAHIDVASGLVTDLWSEFANLVR